MKLTASQEFSAGDPVAPGSCRQMRGHAAFWELHQYSVCAG